MYHAKEAVPALIAALHDSNDGIRWLAGEALIHIGAPSVVPVLEDLVLTTAGPSFYEGAGHVLRHLQLAEFGDHLAPVVAACEHSTSTVEVPVQAERALLAITMPAGQK